VSPAGLALALLLSASAPPGSAAQDPAYLAALERLYDGSTDAALAELDRLAAAHPEDSVAAYLQALALAWKLEQRPDSRALDKQLLRCAERAQALADRRLARDPHDLRAWLARGGAHGVRSRLHMFRWEKVPAARAAVMARADLRVAQGLEPENRDARFGLGLYDYYADVLPRLLKLVRFFMGLPGGDRARGLSQIERSREGTLFHATEVRAQLYSIYAFYELEQDRALAEIRSLRQRYPGSPLWALQLAEHLRERLGLYAESAQVAREIVAEAGSHPNYAPVVGAMGRLALGEALLEDLRLPEARRALSPIRGGLPDAPWIGSRARLLLGRALELEGDGDGALAHYRAAAAADDRELRRRAEAALRHPVPERELRGLQRLAEARRALEGGDRAAAAAAARAALALDPDSQEARLRVAEDELRSGRLAEARAALAELAARERSAPPWVLPWARLLLAQALDRAGQREAAVHLYKQVHERPLGSDALAALAAEGLRRPLPPGGAPDGAPRRFKHSK
jgi:hypothetical protein